MIDLKCLIALRDIFFVYSLLQGRILSPQLFNIYAECVMRKTLENWESVGGRKISNLRYADDTAILANSSEKFTELLNRLEQESNRIGLRINKSKTKIMIVVRANLNNPHIHNIGEYKVYRSSST